MLLHLNLSPITALGLLLLSGYFCGALAHRLKLPALIGYLCAGVLLGPSAFDILAKEQLQQLQFITSISLGCIAFIIGSELQLSSLKRLGRGIIIIILAESLFAFVAVAAGIFILTHDLALAILLGAMAPASAPAGTVAVIQEYKATGTLTKSLYAVVGFDDGLAIIIFGFALAIAKVLLATSQAVSTADIFASIWEPAQEIGLSILLGGLVGWVFTMIVRRIVKKSEYLIIIFWAVLTGVGLAGRWHLSPILVCMVVGLFFVNVSPKGLVHTARSSLQQLMGFIFVFFFGLAGLHLNVAFVFTLGSVGLVYIICRIIGLLSGAWFGSYCGQMEDKIRRYLGLGILSQAGVAIGLALFIQQELAAIPGAEMMGVQVLATITATSIIFEIIGPLATRYGLKKAGEIKER